MGESDCGFAAGPASAGNVALSEMSKVLIIGAGGVGRVVTHKCVQAPEVFSEVLLASRTREKCERIAEAFHPPIATAEVDADGVDAVVSLIRRFAPRLVINVASPYQNLSIMEACARTGMHYVDTSMDDEPESIKYDYAAQWGFHGRFESAGITGLLSLGFDPGVVNVFSAHARKHLFDRIETIDIIDCNAGDNGLPFATNFDPETNIREVLAPALHLEDGEWREVPALSVSREFDFPAVGRRQAYLMAHEELVSLANYIPGLRTARFWMTFSDEYITHVRSLEKLGLTEIEPVDFHGLDVVPLRLLKTLLPDPADLGKQTRGRTSIACLISGVKDGEPRRVMLSNVCSHRAAYDEVGTQAVSYTTGVPATLGARLILSGQWARPGVWNPEQLDPDPFLELIGPMGLPWEMKELSPEPNV